MLGSIVLLFSAILFPRFIYLFVPGKKYIRSSTDIIIISIFRWVSGLICFDYSLKAFLTLNTSLGSILLLFCAILFPPFIHLFIPGKKYIHSPIDIAFGWFFGIICILLSIASFFTLKFSVGFAWIIFASFLTPNFYNILKKTKLRSRILYIFMTVLLCCWIAIEYNKNELKIVSLSPYIESALYFQLKIAEMGAGKEIVGSKEAEWMLFLSKLWIFCKYDFSKSMNYCQRALIAAKELGDRALEGKCLNSFGQIYCDLGEYQKGITYCEKSLKIVREIRDEKTEIMSLRNLGYIYESMGDYLKAINYYEQALKLAIKIRDNGLKGGVLLNLSICYDTIGERPKAMSYGLRASEIILPMIKDEKFMVEFGMRFLRPDFMLFLSEDTTLENILLDEQPAMVIRRLERIQIPNNNGILLFLQYTALALAYEMENNISETNRYFKRAVEKTEEERESLIEGQKTYFFGAKPFICNRLTPREEIIRTSSDKARILKPFIWTRLTPYEGLVRISADKNAFYYSESIKARIFMEQTAAKYRGRLSQMKDRIPQTIREEEITIANYLAALHKQKDAAYKRNGPDAIKRLEEEIKEQRKKRDAFISRLREQYPEYAAIKYPLPLKLSEIALEPGEVLIEYAVTDTETVAWLIRQNKIVKKIRIKKKRNELEALTDNYRNLISEPDNLKRPEFDPKLGHQLYQLLMEEFISRIDEKEHIIIVPDKKLALLPFEALVMSCPDEITYKKYSAAGTRFYAVPGVSFLGDKYKISYYQSASALTQIRTLKKSFPNQEKVLALADPVFDTSDIRLQNKTPDKNRAPRNKNSLSLCQAVEEQGGLQIDRLPLTFTLAEKLENIFGPGNADIMTGTEANETDLKNRDLTKYRHLVMATHGILDGHISGIMEPALILSQIGNSPEDDGFLTLTEVMDLRLTAKTAALTACDTGNGKQLSGEGVMGLGRAFQFAGAKSVLVSLWSVAEESSVTLAERFYFHVKDGKDHITAIQLARREVREAGYDHPFFWAPFVLHGEWR